MCEPFRLLPTTNWMEFVVKLRLMDLSGCGEEVMHSSVLTGPNYQAAQESSQEAAWVLRFLVERVRIA